MASKTFVAFCCLLATATARPATPDASSCSASCSGRKFWTGYAVGSTYTYDFENFVKISSGLNSDKMSVIKVAGSAQVEVHSKCELQLTVQANSAKVSASTDDAENLEEKDVPEEMQTALNLPLRFSFENGRIRSLCPSGDDTRFSLNLKRGILSQIHFGVDSSQQQGVVMETDITGDCWTSYKSLGSNKIEKTKDLSTCRSSFEVFPKRGIKSEASASGKQWAPVQEGETRCEIVVESDRVKSSECFENRILSNGNNEEKAEKVEARSKLTLAKVEASVAGSLAVIADRTDLKHQQKSVTDCQDEEDNGFQTGSECMQKQIPQSGTDSSNFKVAAEDIIKELCELSEEFSGQAARKYAELVRTFRGISKFEDVKAVYTWVTGAKGYCVERKVVRTIVLAAIQNAGTRSSVQLMVKTMGKEEAGNWAAGIGMLQQPTPEIIEDVLQMVISESEALLTTSTKSGALSALTARYCNRNPNCEENDVVKRVIEHFSGAIGDRCANLVGEEVETELKFYALMAIGNIGRISGGPQKLIDCSNNTELPLVYRVFALRALRRFPSLPNEQITALIDFVSTRSLDTELRITAYQIAVKYASREFCNDVNTMRKLWNLFESRNEDVQVQMYVYSHLKNWIRTRPYSSESVQKVLSRFETIRRPEKSGFSVSTNWMKSMKYPSMKSKVDLEGNMIFSKNSMIPRYQNLNLTVESPLSGEEINIFEFGIRIEGMDSFLEKLMSNIYKKPKNGKKFRSRRQASFELKDSQKEFAQEISEARIDIFMRREGMQLSHLFIDKNMLAMADLAASVGDVSSGIQMGRDIIKGKLASLQSAGTIMESTIAVPTVAGLPILVKKEVHYVSDPKFNPIISFSQGMTANLLIQPRASVFMSRTVSVDAIFDRTGIATTTSILTNTGFNISAVGRYTNRLNMEYSFKIDPLQKSQKIIDLKTEAVFFNHDSPSNVKNMPVIASADAAPLDSKCSSDNAMKYFGRRICEQSTYGNANLSLLFIRQTPGEYRFFIEHADSYEAFEATLKLTNNAEKQEFLFVLGDQANTQWHLKILGSVINTADKRYIDFEIANPYYPIKWNSTSETVGENRAVNLDAKFSSVRYKFIGSRKLQQNGEIELSGEIKQVNLEDKKIEINCVYKLDRYALLIIPVAKFSLTAKMKSENSLGFNYLFNYGKSGMTLDLGLSHTKSESVVSSLKSRVKVSYANGFTFMYDSAIQNSNGKNAQHTLSVTQKRSDSSLLVKVIHSFKHGVTLENSILGFTSELMLKSEKSTTEGQVIIAGSGSVNLGEGDDMKTAKLSAIRIVFGNAEDEVDDHKDTRILSLEYTLNYQNENTDFKVAFQGLPRNKWSLLNQCLDIAANVTKTSADGAITRHGAQIRHAFNFRRQLMISQIVSLTYADQVLVGFEHSLRPAKDVAVQYYHLLSAQYSGENLLKVENTFKYVNSKDVTIEIVHNCNLMGSNIYLNFTQTKMEASVANENALANYLYNRGERFRFRRFVTLLWRIVSQMQSTQTFEIRVPEYSANTDLEVDFTQTAGTCLKVASKVIDSGTESNSVVTLTCTASGNSLAELKRNYKLEIDIDDYALVAESGIEIQTIADGYSVMQKLSAKRSQLAFNLTMTTSVALPADELKVTSSLDWTYTDAAVSSSTSAFAFSAVNPMSTKEPYAQVNASVLFADGQKIGFVYDLKYSKEYETDIAPTKIDSTLTLENSIPVLRFTNFESKLNFQSDETVPIYVSVVNSLETAEVLSIIFEARPTEVRLSGVTFIPYIQKYNFSSSYQIEDSDAQPIIYAIQSSVTANGNEISLVDNGRFAFKANDGSQLFRFSLSGVSEVKGLGIIQKSLDGVYSFNYDGKIAVEKSGEYEINTGFQMDRSGDPYLLALINSSVSAWPFEVSGLLNLRSKWSNLNLGNYGFNITAGPTAGKIQLITPENEDSLSVKYQLDTKDGGAQLNSEAFLKIPSLFKKDEPNEIKAYLNFNGNSILVYELQVNVSTPFPDAQFIDGAVSSSDTSQSVVYRLTANNVVKTYLNYSNSMTTQEETVIGRAELQAYGIPPLQFDYISGEDYFFRVLKKGEKEMSGQVVWVKSGKTYPEITGFSVEGANLGIELKFFADNVNSNYYVLRSGSEPTFTWRSLVQNSHSRSPTAPSLNVTVEISNNQVTSGSGTVNYVDVSFSSSSDGVVQISAGSADAVNTITWKNEDGFVKLQFNMGDKESCAAYKIAEGDIEFRYGSCAAPNSLKIVYSMTDAFNYSQFSGDINVQLSKPENNAKEFYILPEFFLNIDFLPPFNYTMQASDGFMKSKTLFDMKSGLSLKLAQEYDLTQMSQAAYFRNEILYKEEVFIQPINLRYNLEEKQFNLVSEFRSKYLLNVSMESISLNIDGILAARAAYLKDQTIEGATDASVIELSGSVASGEPNVLKIWRGSIENGYRMSANFNRGDGKTLVFVTDVTDFTMNLPSISAKTKSELSSSLFSSVRKYTSEAALDFKVNDESQTYEFNYQEKFASDDYTVYDLYSTFSGSMGQIPIQSNIDVRDGWMIANLSYSAGVDSPRGISFGLQISKFGEIRRNYKIEYIAKNYANFIYDFSFAFDQPARKFYLAQSNQLEESGVNVCIWEIFLNKAAEEGIVITTTKNFTAENQYNRDMSIKLPTRTIGFARKLNLKGNGIDYEVTTYGNLPITSENSIKFGFKSDWAANMEGGYAYSQAVSLNAPFLKNEMTKRMDMQVSRNGFVIKGSASYLPIDVINVTVAYNRFWDKSKQAYQGEFNATFLQMKGDVSAEVRITSESRILRRLNVYSSRKYLTEYKIVTKVPSQEIDSVVKIRTVPFEEFTIATNTGSTFSFRYYNTNQKSRVTIFVSNINQQASQLMIVCNKRMLTWNARLDTGTGYMNPESSLGVPFYEPSKLLIKVSAGVSKCGTKIYLGGMTGEMALTQAPSLWKVEDIPSGINYFFTGLKLRKDNTIKYISHWRVSEDKEAAMLLKEALVDIWTLSGEMSVGTAALNQLMRDIMTSKVSNVDAGKLMELLMTLSSNDMDKLSKWAEAARARDDFFNNFIASVLYAGYNQLGAIVQLATERFSSISTMEWLPSDNFIGNSINWAADAVASSISFTPLIQNWGDALRAARGWFEATASGVGAYLDSVSSAITDSIGSASYGANSTVSGVIQAFTSALPIDQIVTGVSQICEIMMEARSEALTDIGKQVKEGIVAFLFKHLGDMEPIYSLSEFLKNDYMKWENESPAAIPDSQELDTQIAMMLFPEEQLSYGTNVIKSLMLLLSGEIGESARQFFKTEAYSVDVWDIKCTTCGEVSQIKGQFYMPVYMKSFRPKGVYSSMRKASNSLNWIGSRAPTMYKSIFGFGGIFNRESITATVKSSGSIETFSGNKLQLSKSCKYLLAHDFRYKDFTILQSYESTASGVARGDLLIRFFDTSLVLSPSQELSINGEVVTEFPANVGITVERSGSTIEEGIMAEKSGDMVKLRFSSELYNVLTVKCTASKCKIKVNPLYYGRVSGALGHSNMQNDIYNNQSEHTQLWAAADCAA